MRRWPRGPRPLCLPFGSGSATVVRGKFRNNSSSVQLPSPLEREESNRSLARVHSWSWWSHRCELCLERKSEENADSNNKAGCSCFEWAEVGTNEGGRFSKKEAGRVDYDIGTHTNYVIFLTWRWRGIKLLGRGMDRWKAKYMRGKISKSKKNYSFIYTNLKVIIAWSNGRFIWRKMSVSFVQKIQSLSLFGSPSLFA